MNQCRFSHFKYLILLLQPLVQETANVRFGGYAITTEKGQHIEDTEMHSEKGFYNIYCCDNTQFHSFTINKLNTHYYKIGIRPYFEITNSFTEIRLGNFSKPNSEWRSSKGSQANCDCDRLDKCMTM